MSDGGISLESWYAMSSVSVLSRVQIDLKETVVQLVCRSSDYTHQYFVRLRIQRCVLPHDVMCMPVIMCIYHFSHNSIKFYDEERRGGGEEESSVDRPSPVDNPAEPSGRAAVETKILELSDITVEVGGVGEGV